jgi:hypothetical protein
LVRAQQAERMRRIGVLVPGTENDLQLRDRIKAFEQSLAKLGWADGRNLLQSEVGSSQIWRGRTATSRGLRSAN